MKDLSFVKNKIEEIKGNFNPTKDTYKILNDIINNNYSVEEIIGLLSKIKGVSKYPNDLKNKFFDIMKELEQIDALDKERKYEEEAKELLKKKQEENTKELKDIINSLEKRNDISVDKSSDAEELPKKNLVMDSKDNDDSNVEVDEADNGKKLFFILLTLVIIASVILICVILFY